MTRLMKPAPLLPLEWEFQNAENRLRRLLGPEFGFKPFTMMEPLGWKPNVDIVEKDAELVLTAELPGLAKEDVEIRLENELLTIRGQKEEEKKEEKEEGKNGEERYLLWERTHGEFVRTFALPRTIDATRISAEMKKGVLTIHLPKGAAGAIKGQKIEIK